ncbi:MAG: NTE family protein [Cognaticolwellia sp.]|jgi:NTE family protein|tara:strand:- start:878 stop:1693 length:816 start_codon:yes stop_codon:yes gene_type:complete
MKQSTGVVLSGGGIRCVAHIGLLKALEQNNIFPTHIAGTGTGAVVGALYSAGYNPDEILEFFRNNSSVFQWSKMTIKKPGILDTDKYQSILFPYLGYITFDQLSKQLFITATNVLEGSAHLFEKGEVIKPVLASSALPPVFSPVEIDDKLYMDGSVMNNFPVEPLLARCNKVIGSFVTSVRPIEKSDVSNPIKLLHRANDLRHVAQAKDKFSLCDYVIEPKSLYKYGNFNANKIEEIYQIGYLTALAKMDKIIDSLSLLNTASVNKKVRYQ